MQGKETTMSLDQKKLELLSYVINTCTPEQIDEFYKQYLEQRENT
jgi:hypothetical protein